jgi:hypothetical protein
MEILRGGLRRMSWYGKWVDVYRSALADIAGQRKQSFN